MTPPLVRILMVEDDPDIQAIARVALEAIGGFVLETCDSGPEALDIAPTAGFDLIILDVMMPGMDGPGTLKLLRTLPQTAATPVIFMTAKSQRHEVAHYLELGAIGVITKPFDPLELSNIINTMWVQYHERVN